MPSSPNWKLRRLADRTLRVHQRKSAGTPALAAFTDTLIPKTQAFIAAYDAARNSEANWKKEMKEGKGAVSNLVRLMRGWLPSFTRDIPGFSPSDFADRPDVPDDVLADATRLLEAGAQNGAPPKAWQASFDAEFTPAFNAAVKEWHEAEAKDAGYQQLLKTSREAAALFDAELQLFRVSLAAMVGTHDKDYQKLRAEKAATKDEEDTVPLAGGDAGGNTPSTPTN